MGTIKSFSASFVSFLVIVSLAGCGSGGGSASSADNPAGSGSGSTSSTGNPPASGSEGGASPTGAAKLSWDAPATYTDGTPVTDLAGFKIYYGTSPGTYTSTINAGMATSYTVNGLASGTYYFTVKAYDSTGNESSNSNEGSKTIL